MAYPDKSDGTLVLLTLAGDEGAYGALVERHQRGVLAAARAAVNNRHLAEDAAQDAFIAAWMKLNLLREPEKFGSWVRRIAKNCALNTALRFRSYISLEDAPALREMRDPDGGPEEMLMSSEEARLVRSGVDRLPERARQVVYLHYYEDMTVEKIAARLGISEGTVKWQLHDGRKRIRKELSAMDENINDTLVRKVMKKVNELKLWKLKNDKTGFEKEYKDVMADIGAMPECGKKYHALADVLMRGYWWLPGAENDALFERIREAAELGKNDEVMAFIASREDHRRWDRDRIKFIREVQIPRLEKGGFTGALGQEWLQLAWDLANAGEALEAEAAVDTALNILPSGDHNYACAMASRDVIPTVADRKFQDDKIHRRATAFGAEIRLDGGALRCWDYSHRFAGWMRSGDDLAETLILTAALCDRYLTVPGLKVGEAYTGTDGSSLTFESDNATVETPCGVFDGCQVWVTVKGTERVRACYKEGVGLVRLEHRLDGVTEARSLKACKVRGGGLLPLNRGNRWEYAAGFDPECVSYDTGMEVIYSDGEKALFTQASHIRRMGYDENSWTEMMMQIRNEYYHFENGDEHICDVSHAVERAELLAKTPLEKAHTRLAASTVRRIMATDPDFNPGCASVGHWNFFQRNTAVERDGKMILENSHRWSFEWKLGAKLGAAGEPILCSHIYGILSDACGCLWADGWQSGLELTENRFCYGEPTTTHMVFEDAGTVSVIAGEFHGCLRLRLDIKGMGEYTQYRAGKKEYYFAPGVGIVKTVNYNRKDGSASSFELASYEGGGEGYMPFEDGLVRRYEAVGLTDGFTAAAEYAYVRDGDGNIVIFEENVGVRTAPRGVTRYDSIEAEQRERALNDEEKYKEGAALGAYNNFMVLYHELRRLPCGENTLRNAAWQKYHLRRCEAAGEDGQVPPALLGFCTKMALWAASDLAGGGEKEESYAYIERAIEYEKRWTAYPKGAKLSVGDPLVFGGIKYVKGEGVIELPDGGRKQLDDDWFVDRNWNMEALAVYYALTAPRGWERFDSMRDEARYKTLVERAKNLI